MGDTKMIDAMVAALTDPFGAGHMGITAENLAKKHNLTREMQDEFACESQRRAAAAVAAGYFKEQIVPITLKTRKGDVVFDTDEHIKANTTMESLAKMKPAFDKAGTVTAGNASGINDGASFLVLADAAKAAAGGHKAMARLVSYGIGGVSHEVMAKVRSRRPSSRCPRPASRSPTSASSSPTKPSLPSRCPWPRCSASIRRRPTRTAARSPSATRLARPAR
jgi:acetyl-CoA C-acetyltransferase